MAKNQFDTTFDFGANTAAKKAKSGNKSPGGKKKRTAAQQATAALYMRPRRR